MVEETPKTSGFDPKDVEENKVIAAIAYIGILCLIPLLAKKDSPFAQAHAKQGLALFIAGFIVSIIGVIPFLGWIIAPIVGLVILVLAIMGLVKALQGEYWEMPLFHDLSQKF